MFYKMVCCHVHNNLTLVICYWKVVKLPVSSVAGMLGNTRLRFSKQIINR